LQGQLKQALTEGLANSQALSLSKVDAVKAASTKAIVGALKAAAVKDIKVRRAERWSGEARCSFCDVFDLQALVGGLSSDEADIAMKHVFK
jgi:hypothetical protein